MKKTASKFLAGVFLTAWMLQPISLKAETIIMKDGSVREGEVMTEDDGSVFLRTGHAITQIDKTAIQSRKRSQVAPPSTQEGTVNGRDMTEGISVDEMEKRTIQELNEYQKIDGDPKKMAEMYARGIPSMEKLKPMLEGMRTNPAFHGIFNSGYEAQAKSRLRKLAATTAVYFMETDKPPKSLDDLIAKGLIEPEFKNIYDGYRYQLITSGDGYKIEAVPDDPKLGMNRFVYNSKNDHID